MTNELLTKKIEAKKYELALSVRIYGFTNRNTIKISQELDVLLNEVIYSTSLRSKDENKGVAHEKKPSLH